MFASVVSWPVSNGRKSSSLRSYMVAGVATFVFITFDAQAHAQTVPVAPPPSLTIDQLDDAANTPGIDPITTGAIDPISHGVGASAEDALQPSAIHYRLPEDHKLKGVGNELGIPLPDAHAPVVIGAPDLKTMIGARLLGDETVVRSYLPMTQRDAIIKAYEARNFEPYWVQQDGTWNTAGQAVLAVLAEANTHGLPITRYLVPSIASKRLQTLADADIRLSIAVATYARDARGGLLDRNKVGPLVMPRLDLPTVETVLAALSDKGEKAGEVLSAYQPVSPGYQALRAKLMALQKLNQELQNPAKRAPTAGLQDGPALRLGQRDEQAPLIRARLGLSPAEDPVAARIYDSMLAEAVSAFQAQQEQPGASAGAGPMVVALAGSSISMLPTRPVDIARLEVALRVNMERWRWLPHDLGERHVLVNVPEQDVKVIENGQVIQRVLAVIGQTETPTPVFSGKLGTVVLNPEWRVSQARIDKEIVPGIMRDNNYANDRGYGVVRDGRKTMVLEPAKVSYELGQIKFMLTSDLSFYLHNTPDHSLFESNNRTLSQGTVRIDEPLKFAENILSKKWTEEMLGKLIGGEERSIRLARPVPIHMTYFTMAVDAEGRMTTYPDIYGYDQLLKSALNTL